MCAEHSQAHVVWLVNRKKRQEDDNVCLMNANEVNLNEIIFKYLSATMADSSGHKEMFFVTLQHKFLCETLSFIFAACASEYSCLELFHASE